MLDILQQNPLKRGFSGIEIQYIGMQWHAEKWTLWSESVPLIKAIEFKISILLSLWNEKNVGTGLHRACNIYIQSLDLYKAYIESSFILVIESSSKIGRVFMPLKPGES